MPDLFSDRKTYETITNVSLNQLSGLSMFARFRRPSFRNVAVAQARATFRVVSVRSGRPRLSKSYETIINVSLKAAFGAPMLSVGSLCRTLFRHEIVLWLQFWSFLTLLNAFCSLTILNYVGIS